MLANSLVPATRPIQHGKSYGGPLDVSVRIYLALLRTATKRLTAPLRSPAERDYYSFDHGPIHFVQFSTEVNFEPGSDQYAFVTADLAAVDRSKTPWVIAGFHRPYITPTVR